MNRAWLAICTVLTVAGCAGNPSRPGGGHTSGARQAGGQSGGYYENDGPPKDTDIDLAAIPDAVPKKTPPSKYGNPASYTALGKKYYVLKSAAGFTQTGRASWYGRQFHGARTSSGEPYNMYKMTAAHKRLPIPSYVRVTNLRNHKHEIVRVNDRGPFHAGRIIDLSYVAARKLGIVAKGSAPVRIQTVTPAAIHAQRASASASASGHDARKAAASRGGNASRRTARGSRATRPHSARPVPVAAHGPTDSHGHLYLQNGAFTRPGNARRLRTRLRHAGFGRARIVPVDRPTPLYRVRIGPFANRRSRDLTKRLLGDQGFPAAEIER